MDAIKSAVGLGKKDQEGQEPVSGMKGEGTAVEPYDSGNQQDNSELGGKAPQETDPSKVIGEAPVDDKTAAATDSTTASGKSEEPVPASAPTSAAPLVEGASAPETSESETSKATGASDSKKPKIGSPSWFKTAIPIGKRKNEATDQSGTTEPQATAGAVQGSETSKGIDETETGLPPNHLGSNVPAGNSTEPVDRPATNEVTSKDRVSATDTAVSQGGEAAMHDTSPAPATSQPQSQMTHNDSKTAAEQPQQYVNESETSQAEPQSQQSGGGLFSNPFSSSDKKIGDEMPPEKRRLSREAYGSNPNAIPTAGGVRIGSIAFDERRKSRDIRRSMSLSQPDIPAEEDEDNARVASADTAGAATTSNVPSSVPDVKTDTAATSDVPSSPPASEAKTDPAATSSVPSVSSPSATTDAKAENEAPSRTSISPSEGKDSRRKIIFGKLKDKLPGQHHKDY